MKNPRSKIYIKMAINSAAVKEDTYQSLAYKNTVRFIFILLA